MELTEQITVLERALKEHIRKWDMFFSGVDRACTVLRWNW